MECVENDINVEVWAFASTAESEFGLPNGGKMEAAEPRWWVERLV
jgi:hypothetical protein